MRDRLDSNSEEHSEIRIADSSAEVEVSKIYTGNGERLQIRNLNSHNAIRIDALGLESLSWQRLDDLAEQFNVEEDVNAGRIDSIVETHSTTIWKSKILNEFAEASVSVLRIDGSDILQVDPVMLDYTIHLPPVILSSLSERDTGLFTRFLETPYGPGD